MDWILIPGWPKFQHYIDRRPAWIKVYTELQHRDEWLHLSLAERGLMLCIWLEYSLREGQLRAADLPSCVLQKFPRRYLDSLQQAGFIEVSASKPLAVARARALAREKEKEKDPPKKVPKQKTTGWRFVRGSHSGTYVRDPAGTDQPPKGYA